MRSLAWLPLVYYPHLLPSGEPGWYGVRVVNGKMFGAGTDCPDIYITLVGTNGSTGKVELMGATQFLKGGTGCNTHEDMIIETKINLGDIQVVVLGIGNTVIDYSWFVEYTVVYDYSKGKAETRFPCYHWIKKNQAVTTTATASKHSNI